MSYVIYHDKLGGFIKKTDGMNIGHQDPDRATWFPTRQEAHDRRPGHHADMGGNGYSGITMSLGEARRWYEVRNRRLR